MMTSVDDGNHAIAAAQETVKDTTVAPLDASLNGDSSGAAAASNEAVQDEVSPEQAPAMATKEQATEDVDDSAGGVADSSVSTAEEQIEEVKVNGGSAVAAGVASENVQVAAPGAGNQEAADAANTMAAASAATPDEDDDTHEQDEIQPTAEDTDEANDVEHYHDAEEDTDDEDVRYHDDGAEYEDAVHNDDAYDPANPTGEGNGDDSYEEAHDLKSTVHADDEYDPANPAEGLAIASIKQEDPANSPTRKRKLSDSQASGASASPARSTASSRSPKRSRNNTAQKVDQRGLRDSPWDRLMDFESLGEFRIAQVSRAAFTSIAQLPEFAQCAIVARFTRTPMKDVRGKNELILRLYREYLSENPLISSLQPVSVYVDGMTADPGLFTFGYAPPIPSCGMSTVKIPYRKDKPGAISTPSAPSASPPKLPKVNTTKSDKPKLDEFGRELKPSSTTSNSSKDGKSTNPSACAGTGSQSTAAVAPAGKPLDPRRRRQGGNDAFPADSTRATSAVDTGGQIKKSEVYNRLPLGVKSRLDGLISARRLPEAINDNVLSRLNHLPESTAVTAIEKFMESDLRQVGNINGFLVGIINRVQERGSAPSDPRFGGSTARSALSTAYHQPQHQPQRVPGQRGPMNSSPAPVGPSHALDHQPGNHQRGPHTQPRMTAASVDYDARNAQQPPAGYTSNPQPAWNPAQIPTTATYPTQQTGTTGGRFSRHPTIDHAISALPVSIQNHLVSLVNSRILPSLDDLSEKCYETLGQLSEGLANDVLKRFGTANLSTVRNYSAFLMGVVKKCRQEYGFD